MRGLIAFIIFLFALLLGIIFITSHHKAPLITGPVVQPLPTYADSTATTSLTTDGIVNGDDLHRQIRITIAQDRRVVEVIQGYSGHVIDSHTFYNTTDAYSVFLRSINNYGFLSKTKNLKIPADERGQCPLGTRYIYSLDDQGENLSRTWSSTCGTKVGTSTGSTSNLTALFQDQIPNYFALTENVNLQSTSTQ